MRERPCRAARTPQELSEPARRRGRRVHAGVTAEGHRPAAGTGVLPSPATLMTGLANISLQMAAGHLKEGLSGPGPTSALPGGTPRHQAACRAAGTPQDTQEPLAGGGGSWGPHGPVAPEEGTTRAHPHPGLEQVRATLWTAEHGPGLDTGHHDASPAWGPRPWREVGRTGHLGGGIGTLERLGKGTPEARWS